MYISFMVESPTINAMRRNLRQALRRRHLEDAAAILERLRLEDPISVETRGGELEFLILSGRLEEALPLARTLEENFPASPRIHYLVGRLHYQRRDYENATESFRESTALAAHWKTRQWLGKSLTQLGRFEDAESTLLEIVEEHPNVLTDMAWLYERMGEIPRAIRTLEKYLKFYPEDEFAGASLQRLRARSMDREHLIEEVQTLKELEEEIPETVHAEYLLSIIESGDIPQFRKMMPDLKTRLPEKTLTSLGWSCHRARTPDLAFELFCRVFGRNHRSPKFLAALESDARRAGRIPELLELYREFAPKYPPLYGRAKSLERRLRSR